MGRGDGERSDPAWCAPTQGNADRGEMGRRFDSLFSNQEPL